MGCGGSKAAPVRQVEQRQDQAQQQQPHTGDASNLPANAHFALQRALVYPSEVVRWWTVEPALRAQIEKSNGSRDLDFLDKLCMADVMTGMTDIAMSAIVILTPTKLIQQTQGSLIGVQVESFDLVQMTSCTSYFGNVQGPQHALSCFNGLRLTSRTDCLFPGTKYGGNYHEPNSISIIANESEVDQNTLTIIEAKENAQRLLLAGGGRVHDPGIPVATAAVVVPGGGTTNELERLGQMKQKGLLTEEEFQQAKQQVLLSKK